MPYLTETIKSLKTGEIYGKAGDKVEIVNDRDTVVIVKLKNKLFSVQKSKLC